MVSLDIRHQYIYIFVNALPPSDWLVCALINLWYEHHKTLLENSILSAFGRHLKSMNTPLRKEDGYVYSLSIIEGLT
jgi:hypothetical protein